MPTIVGILTFMSMINTTSERLKARNLFICQYFGFYEQLKFRALLFAKVIDRATQADKEEIQHMNISNLFSYMSFQL